MKKIEIVIVVFLFVVAFLLRFPEVYFNNFLFLIDQGRDLLDVKRIVFDGHLTLIGPYTGIQGVFQGPFYYYFLAVPLLLSAGNPWGPVFLMFLLSFGTVLFVYYFLSKFLDRSVAIFALFLLAVSPEAIAAATYIWNPHPMWPIIALYLFFFYKVVFGKEKYIPFLFFSLGLMFHFESAGGFFILVGTLLYLFLYKRKTVFTRYFGIGLGFFLILFIPQLFFDFRHDFLMTKSVINVLHGSDQGLFSDNEKMSYLNRVRANIDTFYYNFSSSFVRDGYLIYLPNAMLFLLAGVLFLKRKVFSFSKKEILFLNETLKILFIIFVLVILFPFPIRYWYLTGYQLFYIAISALVLNKFIFFQKGRIIIALLIMIILFYTGEKLVRLYKNPDYGGIAKIQGKSDAIDYIYQDASGQNFNLLVFSPPIYTDPYDYLIWWKAKKNNLPVPGNKKEGIFYLLIEPDPHKPWSYKGWLETVIKTGKIIDEKVLPSGLIIQKRLEE